MSGHVGGRTVSSGAYRGEIRAWIFGIVTSAVVDGIKLKRADPTVGESKS